MSQSPPNYMEDVPVKISEKYKPPPRISIPYSIQQRLKSEEQFGLELSYDFILEQNVLSKVEQWKKMREIERESRRERMRKYELERAKKIEEKQKQLLTAVSYPSTEELSSDDEDTGCIKTYEDKTQKAEVHFSNSQQYFDTILTPTVVPEACNQVKCNSVKLNTSKINYSDFENDTSSPFDNVELKTINDLDILAQVLNITQVHSTSDEDKIENTVDNQETSMCEEHSEAERVETNSNGFVQTLHTYPAVFTRNTNLSSAYDQTTSLNSMNANGTNKNQYYYYNLPINQNYNDMMYNNYRTVSEGVNVNLHNYQRPYSDQINFGYYNTAERNVGNTRPDNLARSKSKSVPDILKELNDEVTDSEMRRFNNSHRIIENEDRCTTSNRINLEDEMPESFMKLSPSSQVLVKNISLMGFPLERVSKIAEKLGSDDKKIVEHLIPLSELLDFGFEESKISEALLKFDNNKEKALDFLIS